MSHFGKNMKLLVARGHREQLHATLTEALGCKSFSPEDDLTIYAFEDGFNLGVYFVSEDQALPDAQLERAPWLEVHCDDVTARGAALERLGVRIVPYPRDQEHTYYALPGGPVFRLAATPT